MMSIERGRELQKKRRSKACSGQEEDPTDRLRVPNIRYIYHTVGGNEVFIDRGRAV